MSSDSVGSSENASKLPSLQEFSTMFSKYPAMLTYNLVRDLILKADSLNQIHDIIVLDGKKSLNLDDYVVIVNDRGNNKNFIYVSFMFEDKLDLNWIHEVCRVCELDGLQVVLCVHCVDGIIYQTIEAELPSLQS